MKIKFFALIAIILIASFSLASCGPLTIFLGTESIRDAIDDEIGDAIANVKDNEKDLIYSADAPGTFQNVSESVTKIYILNDGSFKIYLDTVGNYEKDPIKLTLFVSSDGFITDLDIDEYTDSIDVREKDKNFIDSFIGQSSALADVDIVSGCTYSSMSIKNAVKAGMDALVDNGLIGAGAKEDVQVLKELIYTVYPELNSSEPMDYCGGSIIEVYKNSSGVGYAYIVNNGNENVLAIVNAMGACRVFNTSGADVTERNALVIEEVLAHFASVNTNLFSSAGYKFKSMVEDADNVIPIMLNLYNTIVYSASFEANGITYYGFYSRVYGFEQMDIYIVLDENGAITKLDADEFIFYEEYFGTLDKNYNDTTYKNGFTGLTDQTFTEDHAMISGATMTSNAVKTAVNDAFEAFKSIK